MRTENHAKRYVTAHDPQCNDALKKNSAFTVSIAANAYYLRTKQAVG